ncbi:hypothetical protein [Streptococcus sp. E17BB]|uniref:hypothetical protein n=1 Tax=Streptococcus sp. E17BB TaxID=3278714 RepID=UPI00359CF372
MKNNKFYELVKSSFRSVSNRIQNFIGKNLREEIRTKSLEDIKIDICLIEDIDDILNYIVGYYNTYYSIYNLNRLMNVAILCRKQDPHSEYSFKIMIQLYLYLMIRHKEGLNKNVIISDELEIFFLFLNVIQNNISNNQVGQSVKRGRNDALQSYLNYNFIPPNGLNIEINLMERFEDWVIPFDKMKNEYVLNQIGIYKMK